MLTASIKIMSIDYESTFTHIFPVVSEKLMAMDSKKMIIRLFQQLGDASLPVLLGVMNRLQKHTKDELLVRCLNAYAPRLMDRLNEEFLKDKWGQYFEIDAISISRQDGILLNVGQIKVKYPELLQNEQVQKAMQNHLGKFAWWKMQAAGVASVLLPDMLERTVLEMLWQDENKERIMALIRTTLVKYGIMIELGEIYIAQTQENEEAVTESSQPFTLTEEMETDIINALAGYLRDAIKPA